VMVSTPGAVHDTVVESTKTVADAVNVMVSPLTSAVVTPIDNVIEVGVCPATRSVTVAALVHASAVSTMVTAADVPTAAEDESSTVNVYAAAAGFAARPPVHVIVFAAAALIPPAPTVSVKVPWFSLIATPPAAIAVVSAPTAQRGVAPPTFHSA